MMLYSKLVFFFSCFLEFQVVTVQQFNVIEICIYINSIKYATLLVILLQNRLLYFTRNQCQIHIFLDHLMLISRLVSYGGSLNISVTEKQTKSNLPYFLICIYSYTCISLSVICLHRNLMYICLYISKKMFAYDSATDRCANKRKCSRAMLIRRKEFLPQPHEFRLRYFIMRSFLNSQKNTNC